MKTEELKQDPIVKMLLEDIQAYLAGNDALLAEAKRSIMLLKKEYDVTPSFLANVCDTSLSRISEMW